MIVSPTQNVLTQWPQQYEKVFERNTTSQGIPVQEIRYRDKGLLINKIAQITLVALATICSLGLLLIFKEGRNLWTNAINRFKEHVVFVNMSTSPSQNSRTLNSRLPKSLQAFRDAFNLIPTNQLELPGWGPGTIPHPVKDQEERFKKLKKCIRRIHQSDINNRCGYRDGMMTYVSTLLLHTIQHLKDPTKRLAVVQLLLNQGAKVKICGSYYSYVYPLTEAQATGDTALIKLLQSHAATEP